jgi:hypothetical protein
MRGFVSIYAFEHDSCMCCLSKDVIAAGGWAERIGCL